MISTTAITARRLLLVAFLWAIVATETRASTAFVVTTSQVRAKPRLEESMRGGAKFSTADAELQDCGGSVAGLFGNLRIPASLIAGASLGSAFALPFLPSDGAKIGIAKRLYALSMLTTLGSMLLVIIVGTIAMNDIAIQPTRMSKSVGKYIEEHYGLEWMLVRSHFFYGAFAFLSGTAFRAYVDVACPIIGTGIIGILGSLGMICISALLEKSSVQFESTLSQRFRNFLKAMGAKAKRNTLFGTGVFTWIATVAYLLIKIPHMYNYLASM